jgi:PAS domain S-box-containing protein
MRARPPQPEPGHRPFRVIAVAAAYLIAAIIGLASTQETNGLAALWPSDAILLAALLLRPAATGRLIAWCGCAAFAATLWFGASPLGSLWFAVADTMGVLAGALIGRHIGVGPCAFDRPAEVMRFCAVAVVAATAGATLAALPAFAELGPGSGIWLSWFLSDLLGILVLTPLCLMLAWARQPGHPRGIARPGEAIASLGLVALTACGIFSQSRYPLLFLPVAPMMMVAYRVGPTGTAAGIMVVAAIGTLATLAGLGPVALAAGTVAVHIHFLQFYLATIFAICLPMAAALAHRNRLAGIVRDSEARHRRIVERSHMVIFETDLAGRWTFLNPTWAVLSGRDAAASLGRSVLDAIVLDDRRALLAAVRTLRGTLGEVAHDVRYQDADGQIRWARAAVFPIRDGDGAHTGYHGTIEDITERRAAHAAIAASERRYRLLADNASDMILRIALDGTLRYASPACERLLGERAEALAGRSLLAGVGDADRDRLREACTALLGGAPDQTCTYRQTRADGSVVWLETAIQLVRERNRAIEFIASVRDVTRRKIAEVDAATALAALQESHRLLSLAGTVSRVGHWRLDVAAEAIHWSEEVHRIHGVPVTSPPPPLADAIDFYHPDDRAMVERLVDGALTRGENFEFNARILARDGAVRHIVSNGQVERTACGAVGGVFGVIQDITERRLAELELRASEERFRIITEQAGDMISLHEVTGEALFVSPSAHTILGHDPRDAFGPTVFVWMLDDDDRAVLAEMHGEILSGGSPSGRVRMRRADGRPAWMEVRPRLTEIAGDPRVIAVWRDVTESVERETELGAARAQAEAALSAKAEFLANMSHEIRTPMNGVIGFTELLLASELDETQRHHAQLIADSGEAMMRLLNDILDLSKIDAGRLDVAAEPMDLTHTLAGCVKLLAPTAERKGLDLTLEVADDLPRAIRGDALRVRQVILNLLGNAVKFTASGGVTLAARGIDGRLAIAVADTGIGIAPERQDAIFEQFVQADHSITRAYGGSGLGLAISNRLAALMGGGLSLESTPGRGTTITLDLPLVALDDAALPERTRPPRIAPPAARSAHVLLADDHDINQILVTAMLARAGHRVTVAGDGAAAVAQVEAGIAAGTPFDMVLMDVQMPVMDGLTATRAIRALGGAATTLPIVALTANAFAADLEACRAAGMDDHLAKPVSIDRLIAVIERRVPAPARPRRAPFRPSAALAERYAEQRAATLAAVDALIRDGALAGTSLESLAELLHKLAGTAAMFGEAELGDRARDLELGLRGDAGGSHDALRSAAERLRAAA